MSESRGWLFEPSFNRSVKLRQADSQITSDAGCLLLREIDHRLAVTANLAAAMLDPRDPAHTRYTLTELLRQRIYGLAQGYPAQDDADGLAHDAAFKLAVWDRPGQRVADERLASQSSHSRLLDILAGNRRNLAALRAGLSDSVLAHQRASGPDRRVASGTVDIDAFPIEVSGEQPGGAYNGYYQATVYNPLLASFAPGGDYDGPRLGEGFIHALLRRGNCGPAESALRFIRVAVAQARRLARSVDARIDAAFVVGPVIDPLTDDGIRFVGRLKSNPVLQRLAEPFLGRPVGRPPTEGYQFTVELGMHRAASWRHAQRLILVVVDPPDAHTGRLFDDPEHFFLLTNWRTDERTADELLEHYRGRGTFEDRFAEFNAAIDLNLSQPTFAENEATLLLGLHAFNLAGIVRAEMEDAPEADGWDLGRVQKCVLKAGGRLVRTARRVVLYVAAPAAGLWRRLLGQLDRWRRPERPYGPRPRPWVPPPAHAHRQLVLRC